MNSHRTTRKVTLLAAATLLVMAAGCAADLPDDQRVWCLDPTNASAVVQAANDQYSRGEAGGPFEPGSSADFERLLIHAAGRKACMAAFEQSLTDSSTNDLPNS